MSMFPPSAPPAGRGAHLARRAAALLVALAACGTDSPKGPVPVATVAITLPTVGVVAGTQHALAAATLDGRGNALTGRAVTWSTDNSAIASVSSTGMLSAVAPGPVTVRAESEGKTGTAQLTVLPVPVATVVVAPDTATLVQGGTVQLAAQPRSAAGVPLGGRAVAWSSDATGVATVSETGLVTAVGVGEATIRATSESRTGTATITVTPVLEAPVVATVAPATLVPGATATLTGTGFDPVAGNNLVTIRGVFAPVTSATATALQVTVPCVQGGAAEVRVIVGNRQSAPVPHPVEPARHALAPGQSLMLAGVDAARCNELAPSSASARYLVTVYSAATSLSDTAVFGFEVGGNVGTGSAPVIAAARAAAPPLALDPALARQETLHRQRLESNRQLYETVGRLVPRAVTEARVMVPREPPAPGTMRDVNYHFGSCAAGAPVMRVKAIYVGTRAVIWEDSANALQSANDAALAGWYRRLGEVFDRDQYEAVRRYFGDPLRRDAETDADGRLHMVFTQRLNGSGAAAYVHSCDQYPPSAAASVASSNHGEYFYGQVPVNAGSNINSSTFPDGWFAFMTRTVVHEVKHIASHAARVANASPVWEQSWLEEGTARMAEEMWVRDSLHRTPWKSNAGWGTAASNGVFCDFHLSDMTCAANDPLRRPTWGMRRQLHEIRNKLLQPWNWSPYGDAPGQSGAVFYNSTWSLVRWTIDRYGTSDEAFLTQLTNATTNGVANLSAVAGAPLDRIIGGWGMSLYADDYPGMPTTDPDLQFRTWNLRSIYAGLHDSPLWAGSYPTTFPVTPAPLPAGGFSSQVPVLRGGAHAFFELSGSTAAQLLHLRGIGGGPLDPDARLAIARLQ